MLLVLGSNGVGDEELTRIGNEQLNRGGARGGAEGGANWGYY